jgi:hypothetical protein
MRINFRVGSKYVNGMMLEHAGDDAVDRAAVLEWLRYAAAHLNRNDFNRWKRRQLRIQHPELVRLIKILCKHDPEIARIRRMQVDWK